MWEAPSATMPSIPKDVDDVILKALRKEPKDRYGTATEFGEALKKLRTRYAPDVRDGDVGELLARVFAREKTGEDAVLHEAVYGQTINMPISEKTRRAFVPPTALAFEHTAVLASADFVPKDDQDITDPGREDGPPVQEDGTPTPSKDPRLTQPIVHGKSRRTGFGVTFAEAEEPVIEHSLIQEIEASDDFIEEQSDPEADTRSNYQDGKWKMVVLLSGIFLFATGLGFLAVWLALR